MDFSINMPEKVRPRKHELKLVLFLLSCQLLITCGRPASRPLCYKNVYASVGRFDSAETGARAAVQRLSQEIHRCPVAEEYYVEWNFPEERGWRAVKYTRQDNKSGVAGYEYDPSSGRRQPIYLVEDSAVDQVAKEGGTLDDFAKYQKNE
jgi:hypothetical protein